jgi:3-oxoacyl-[acyl-carrier protein] reductase
VLVTGGSRGIGLEIARRFSAAGASVTITARREPALRAALGELGERSHAVAGDAADPDHAATAVAAAVERFGPLSVVVANVGGAPYAGPLVDAPTDALLKTFNRNVAAPLNFVREAWRQSMEREGGVIILIGSLGGMRVRSGNGAYNITKAALHHMARQLALELAPGVRVISLVPGLIRTDFALPLYEGREEDTARELPLGRLGEPADVAELALALASPAAGWVTGVEVVVDGGASLLSGGRTAPTERQSRLRRL